MPIESFVIEKESLDNIRRALLVGLAAFGEIERLDDARQGQELLGREVPQPLRAIHPTGSANTISQFAEALGAVEYARRLE